jgi:L-ascorbate metabolism protein UlaG (beta-lactamase superfamily)
MSQVAVTSYGHSTVRLRHAAQSIVIDPGILAPDAAFADVAGFLITHEHQDHADVPRIAASLAIDASAHAWVPSEVADQLAEAGGDAAQLTVITEDAEFDVAGLSVRAFVDTHAEIYRTLPPSANIAYLVDGRLLHPGDSFPAVTPAPAVDVLFLPMSGPWMRFSDAADYVDLIRPGVIVPIHDGDLRDLGRQLTDQMSGLLPGDGTYGRLEIGVPVEL